MITVKTYLKHEDSFYLFSEFNHTIKDPDYIEGSIELVIDDVELMSIWMWDYVDQLWAYIVQGLVKLSEGEDFSTNYPDQPIKVKFTHLYGEKIKISVRCHEEKSVVVNKMEFIKVMKEHVKCFFSSLNEKVPGYYTDVYKELTCELDAIRK